MNDTLLMVFTGVLTLAVVIQTILFFGIYRAIRQMSVYLDGVGKDLRKNVEIISAKVDEGLTAIKGLAEGFKPIRDKLADSTEIIHYRITELDAFLAETTATARQEIRHIQDSFQAALQKVEQTLETLRKSLLGPLNEISAITRAVRVAMDVLFRRRRNPSSSQDEEMFI
jgi:ABC-type transporter Mla subunit MlaD